MSQASLNGFASSDMTEAPVKLPAGHAIPVLSNEEIATLFDHEDLANLNDVYRGR
jgi:hypothetical protein